jgi:mannan endo-1,4-beta-mannosidase
MKVLRVWLDGHSDSPKNTPISAYPSLEPNSIGSYDPTVLNRLDAFMVDAHARGIKLLISIHSFNALSSSDVYGKVYGTGYFYEQTLPQQQFDNRIRYVMDHVHTTLGKPWKQLSEYIFAFEAQNEAMIGKGEAYIQTHQAWQCDRAKTIKDRLAGNTNVSVFRDVNDGELTGIG